MLKIKVCGMTDPGNTKEIAGTNPDFIGFIFYDGSKRYVGDKPPQTLFNNVSYPIMKTGVFVDADPSRIHEIMKTYKLDLLQLHGNETPEYCRSLKENGYRIVRAFEVTGKFNFNILEQCMDVCDYFLFDTKTGAKGGSGLKFNWEILKEYHLEKPFFLSGGISPDDIPLIKEFHHNNLFALDINSCFEIEPGIKDFEKVKNFIKEIKG